MRTIATLPELRAALGQARPSFVPTMGSLHDGHLALVRMAATLGGPTVVSIFVNRLQFAPHEDFDRYPRTLARDAALLDAAGCDILFAPDEAALYPEPQTYRVQPDPELADILEGAHRPGFFGGVCTVVLKLLCAVQPSAVVFGAKDYQQWRVVERMVRQFALPVAVHAHPIVRAADGLALSSRNAYLDPAQRLQSTALARALHRAAAAPAPDRAAAERDAVEALTAGGWRVDYLTVRRRSDLQPPSDADAAGTLVALGAAHLGTTRLIDNLEC